MKLRVLGCSGSIAAGSRTTAFLLDDDVLVDAGTGVGELTLDELASVDHVVLSHSHLDHILSIPLLADSVMRRRMKPEGLRPIHVHGLPQTLKALTEHVFNNVLWPDFTRLPSPAEPILKLHAFEIGHTLTLGGKRIEILPAAHTVPACGMAVDTPAGWWIFSGDTGPNPALWEALQGRRIAQLVIETAFSDEELALAKKSKHLSPSLLGTELKRLDGSVTVQITHAKPGELEAVMAEIHRLDTPHRITALTGGERFEF